MRGPPGRPTFPDPVCTVQGTFGHIGRRRGPFPTSDMAVQRRRSHPETRTAGRLEFVRSKVQCTTLREFWRELTKKDYEISYEAVRNYHYDREPPVDYLVQVSTIFDVNLRWLATGDGQPWPAEPGVDQAAEEASGETWRQEYESGIQEHLRTYETLPPLAVAVVLRTCDRLYRDAQFRARLASKSGPSRSYIGRFVGKAIAGPLVNAVAGTVKTSDLHAWQIESYVLGLCTALTALIPNPNWTSQQIAEGLPH